VLVGFAVAFVVGAQVSPLAHWADTRSFAAHMAQHLLIGDLAPLALAVAFAGAAFGRTLSPVLTFAAWVTNLAAWHVPVVYEAALHHVGVHALQHVALFVAGLALWSPVFALTRTPLWFGDEVRLGYLLLTMFIGVVLGAIFLWWPHVIYSTYAHAHGLAGLSPHGDQRAGGGLMLLEGSVVTITVAGWIVWRIFRRAEPNASPSP
jgi:putative membrane protein